MATVISYNMLNDDVLEIIIQEPKIFPFKPGQRALLGYKDEIGEFKRAYSIADYEIHGEVSEITLCIKLLPEGRGSKILKTLKVGDIIPVGGVFGHFVLQETDAPKVFIGTGTGLVPVFNMAKACEAKDNLRRNENPKLSEDFQTSKLCGPTLEAGASNEVQKIKTSNAGWHKMLIYSTPYMKEMFYEEYLKKIPNLKLEIHITREEVAGYKFGRFDLDTYDFDKESEFYICGNPTMVVATVEKLKSMGFTKIFSEQF